MLARLMLSLILGLSEYGFEINFIAQLEIKTCTTFNLVNCHYLFYYQIVVLGGSGFVGSAICKAAVSKGIEVISLSRCNNISPRS